MAYISLTHSDLSSAAKAANDGGIELHGRVVY